MPTGNPYDRYSGLRAIESATQGISAILAESDKAIQQKQMLERRQRGIDVLNAAIAQRSAATKGIANVAPMLDPVVQKVALAVSPVAKDYVDILSSFSAANAKAMEPKAVPGGYIQYDPAKGTYGFTQTKEDTKTPNEKKDDFWRGLGLPGEMSSTELVALGLMDRPGVIQKDEAGTTTGVDLQQLGKEFIKAQTEISASKTAAGTGIRRSDVTEATAEENTKEAASKVTALKNYGFSDSEIGQILAGDLYGENSRFPRKRFQYITGGNIKLAPSIEKAIESFSKLTPEEQEAYRRQYPYDPTGTAPGGKGTAGAESDTTKPQEEKKKPTFDSLMQ